MNFVCHSHHFISVCVLWGFPRCLPLHVALTGSGVERATCGVSGCGQIYTMCNDIAKVDCVWLGLGFANYDVIILSRVAAVIGDLNHHVQSQLVIKSFFLEISPAVLHPKRSFKLSQCEWPTCIPVKLA